MLVEVAGERASIRRLRWGDNRAVMGRVSRTTSRGVEVARRRRGTCVYCLREVDTLTKDHVPPRSWYPTTTPPELQRWTVLACRDCNLELGRLEADLLLRFALCLDPRQAAASGVAESVFRAIDAAAATDERDRAARERLRERIIAEVKMLDVGIAIAHGLPGFVSADWDGAPQPGLFVSAEDLERFGEKMVRAVTFKEQNALIGTEYQIEFYFDPQQGRLLARLIDQFGRQIRRGPGLLIERAIPRDDRVSSVNFFELWGQLRFWATVRPRGSRAMTEDG